MTNIRCVRGLAGTGALTKLLALDNNDLCAIDDPGIDQYQIDDNQNKYYQIKSHSLIQCLNNM